ncbi:MAG TPA: hypothetical protein VMQ65_02020 [Candidatus Limnocylindria bacterium]|nr:hypothetical protein [Candidatus Limnocylindria bacterium]
MPEPEGSESQGTLDPGRASWGEGPVASTAWSPDFLAQTLELLIVHHAAEAADTAATDGIRSIRPIHAPSIQVGWGPGSTADSILGGTLSRYGLEARVLHSTSWRHDGDHVVLTYLAVTDAPAGLNPNLTSEPVAHTELARGGETVAPASIATAQVLEHALRHLAWLVTDDPAVSSALPEWRSALEGYLPEPFRQL